METIMNRLSRLLLAEPQGNGALLVVPLLDVESRAPHYELLQAALASKSLTLTEMDAGGRVPEVKAINDGATPVLLLDGAALVGAKQNRVLNLTVLLPAKATTVIPVSCVEQGRWQSNSTEFGYGESLQFALNRAEKMASVTACRAHNGAARSDQHEVWENMSAYGARFQADAPSGSMQDIYKAVDAEVNQLVDAIRPREQQVGAAFVVRGQLLGVELFDSHATLAAEWNRIVRSYAVDAVRGASTANKGFDATARAAEATGELLSQISAADWSRYPGVGLGDNLHLDKMSPYSGVALEYDADVVHLAVLRRALRTRTFGEHVV